MYYSIAPTHSMYMLRSCSMYMYYSIAPTHVAACICIIVSHTHVAACICIIAPIVAACICIIVSHLLMLQHVHVCIAPIMLQHRTYSCCSMYMRSMYMYYSIAPTHVAACICIIVSHLLMLQHVYVL